MGEQVLEQQKEEKVIQVCINGYVENCPDIDAALDFIKKQWEKNGFYFSGKLFYPSDNVVKDMKIEREIKYYR